MKDKLLLLLFITTFSLNAQIPTIQWQKSFGGSNEDYVNHIIETSDGGYALVGKSLSTDIMDYHGNFDLIVMKLDNAGNVQWQRLLGGSGVDEGHTIKQTSDGGFIIAAESNSNDGDITGHHGGVYPRDAWIIKLSSIGNIQWQKSIGGDGDDTAYSIQQTSDGGYIFSGYSNSNNGDLTLNYGGYDFLIVKLNSAGTIVWQKTFGGSDYDYSESIQQTSDGGYIVAGATNSYNGDVTSNQGSGDWWIIKLNANGALQWQKSFGGTNFDVAHSIKQTLDGGYIVAGMTHSSDGDVTNHHGIFVDIWVVKISSNGILQWQKALGGSEIDSSTLSIAQIPNGDYIISGYTYSNDGDITNNHGNYDYWLANLNSSGQVQWQKCYGGSDWDKGKTMSTTSDGGFIMAGESLSTDGDVTINNGLYDIWVIKLNSGNLSVPEFYDTKFVIYPNPAENSVTIDLDSFTYNTQININDVLGNKVYSKKIEAFKTDINISHLKKGVYFITVINKNNKKTITQKLIVD